MSQKSLTPREIVTALDHFVVGQQEAKRAVANALRNRWRRKFVPEDIRDEIIPHNILMVGPTGVGKTEIARRLAKLTDSPFIKVEVTKFTEIGYVGRDVDSIIRDLLDKAISKAREVMEKNVVGKAADAAQDRIVNTLVGESATQETKDKFLQKLKNGTLDDKEISIELMNTKVSGQSGHTFDVPGGQLGVINIGEMLSKAMETKKAKLVKTSVRNAYIAILREESDKLIDEALLIQNAIKSTEEDGIVFLDEIDKIASRQGASSGRGEVSREGVQRDLLPLIEGTVVTTKHGPVRTNHILFISSGAFHTSKPSDLLPELQGRLPVRVELKALNKDDLVRILKDPKYNLPKQYKALMEVEKIELSFTDSGIREIAQTAIEMNELVENIGARRLHTILEKLLEEISFEADSRSGSKVTIDEEYVKNRLSTILKNKTDSSKFIL